VATLWTRYPDLSEGVITQLRKATKEIAYLPGNITCLTILATLDGEIEWDKARIGAHSPWTFEGARLRARHDTLLSARGIFKEVKSPFS